MTYEALVRRAPELLTALGAGDVADQDLVVFYRPSFGRGGGPQFGEADAVLCTPGTLYHIESKWQGSSENQGEEVVLEKRQVLRHRILRWYVERWLASRAKRWTEFATPERQKELQSLFPHRSLPRATTNLAANLTTFLRLAARPKVVDVVLFLAWEESEMPRTVVPEDFRLVSLRFRRVKPGWMFDMD